MNAKSKQPRKLAICDYSFCKESWRGVDGFSGKAGLALLTFASSFCEPGRPAFLIPSQNRLENSCKLCCNLNGFVWASP